ncbi:hypothetical protein CASFOL_011784 [Castilleja foliolosa]|uniref:Reverse transcriptase Ty1/copia-type domain-containing protein n=1 Tax=Castilleja foliolosa TaxID=1961234 RepID=A0ABD3DQG4_9LAMI
MIPTTTVSDSVQVPLPITVRETDLETHEDNIEQLPHQVEAIVPEEQTQQPQEQVPIRRSTRERRNAITAGSVGGDPITFQQAMQDFNSQNWIDAMNEEYKSMQDNKVWDLVPLPEGKKPIGCKWIFKTKRDSKGNVERYKARLVAKGFTQKEGIDFTETFSPVSSKDSLRIMMAF